jgi:hypothetical protein
MFNIMFSLEYTNIRQKVQKFTREELISKMAT